jgi:hypothetical protein
LTCKILFFSVCLFFFIIIIIFISIHLNHTPVTSSCTVLVVTVVHVNSFALKLEWCSVILCLCDMVLEILSLLKYFGSVHRIWTIWSLSVFTIYSLLLISLKLFLIVSSSWCSSLMLINQSSRCLAVLCVTVAMTSVDVVHVSNYSIVYIIPVGSADLYVVLARCSSYFRVWQEVIDCLIAVLGSSSFN